MFSVGARFYVHVGVVEAPQVEQDELQSHDPGVIEEADLDAMLDLVACWLAAGALDFMALREFREQSVDQHVDGCWKNEPDDLRQDDAHELDGSWPVRGNDVGPGGLQLLQPKDMTSESRGRWAAVHLNLAMCNADTPSWYSTSLDYQGVDAHVVPRFGCLQCHGSVPTWPNNHRILRHDFQALRKPPSFSQIACVGAGLSAVALGATLQRWYGLEDIQFFEKHPATGGTWYINTSLGCSCDVPRVLHNFSFALNPNWTKLMPSNKEIKEYVDNVVDTYNLRSRMTFGTEVVHSVWREDANRWLLYLHDLETGCQYTHEGQILFAATGQLD
ncbi:monooxygenase [Aspergillus udagawae]|nr:monooxygenase [Aspergillus udagawae]